MYSLTMSHKQTQVVSA